MRVRLVDAGRQASNLKRLRAFTVSSFKGKDAFPIATCLKNGSSRRSSSWKDFDFKLRDASFVSTRMRAVIKKTCCYILLASDYSLVA
jgi:hypothetical protein